MLKKTVLSVLAIIFIFGVAGCPEAEKTGEWFDFAVMGITYSAYANMSIYGGYQPDVVYKGNDAKDILESASYHIDKDVGAAFEEKKTYKEIVAILEELGLPLDLIKKSIGSITAYYYISETGKYCVAVVEDTTFVHGRNVLSGTMLSTFSLSTPRTANSAAPEKPKWKTASQYRTLSR